MTPYKRLIEQMELKGIPFYKQHELLSKYGYKLFVFDPTPQGQYRNEFYIKQNNKAIEQALIEVDYWV